MICKICENNIGDDKRYKVKENMFGYEEFFDYYLCSNCSCLQLSFPPDNIQKYYSSDYYTQAETQNKPGRIKRFFYITRSAAAQTFLYNIANLINKRSILVLIHYGNIKFNSKILDIGCGNGSMLYDFLHYGYRNLTGIDPFLKEELTSPRLKLFRKKIFEMSGKYDVIIFNHSFEHIREQDKTLNKAAVLLEENGVIIISQPILNFAFEKYGEHWVQLDAPRHFFIHSGKSMDILCRRHNLKIEKVFFNSTDFQFLGSEQIKKGIPLTADNSYKVNFNKSIFSPEDVKKYRKSAERLNREGRGDQAVFFLRKR